jgi:hypothetical protein
MREESDGNRKVMEIGKIRGDIECGMNQALSHLHRSFYSKVEGALI